MLLRYFKTKYFIQRKLSTFSLKYFFIIVVVTYVFFRKRKIIVCFVDYFRLEYNYNRFFFNHKYRRKTWKHKSKQNKEVIKNMFSNKTFCVKGILKIYINQILKLLYWYGVNNKRSKFIEQQHNQFLKNHKTARGFE